MRDVGRGSQIAWHDGMRSSVLMMMALGAVMAGCGSQPLTGNMTGTGGTGTGAGATGGFAVGATGGTGGAAVTACLNLANQYQQALGFAQTCDVGADGECKVVVAGALSVCGSCPTMVTDSSKLDLLQQRWDAANCFDILPKVPCPLLLCATPTSAMCVAADGGATGTCSPQYTSGTGGSTGGPVDGGSAACSALADKYAAVLATVTSCTVGAANQCTFSVSPTLLPCRTECVQYVNDTTELDAIRTAWEQQGCSTTTGGACPPVSCSAGNGPTCSANDGGSASCGGATLLLLK